MICKPNELNFDDKKISMIISGVAGIGKTTLALSSPKPLLVDLDNGVSRVEARYRKDTLIAKDFNELKNDLSSSDLSDYETIVIDTGGKLLEMLKPVVIKENAKNGQSDGSLSLKGYGAVKKKFSEFISFVKSLNKNLVLVFHATEVNLADDVTGLRIRCEGSSRDEVWDDIDVGGFIEIIGKRRTIGFSNCQRYYAKGSHNVRGIYDIPQLDANSKNNFLTLLFEQIKNDLNNEQIEFTRYQDLMKKYIDVINTATADNINDVFKSIQEENHILTSKEELWFMISEQAKKLGLTYDKESKQFN